MTDISKTIEPKSDQMNADDLIAKPVTITVTDVRAIGGPKDAQPIAINYQGDDGKPYKPCKSMRRVLVKAWGAEGKEYVGRRMTLFCDPNVTFGGAKVGGIRISHLSHIDSDFEMQLTISRAMRRPYRVKKLSDEAPNTNTEAPAADDDLIEESKTAASFGMAAYERWFTNQIDKGQRAALQASGQHIENKKAAAEADKEAGSAQSDVDKEIADKGLFNADQ